MAQSWPLEKLYFAAHYFISTEKTVLLSEAQRATLGALHMFVCYGTYAGQEDCVEFQHCTHAETKKRIEEWKKLENLTRPMAMALFVDMLHNLSPSWTRNRRLFTDFEQEWIALKTKFPTPRHLPPKAMQTRTSTIVQTKPERRPISLTIDSVNNFQKSRYQSYISRKPVLNARHDARDTVYNLSGKKLGRLLSLSRTEAMQISTEDPPEIMEIETTGKNYHEIGISMLKKLSYRQKMPEIKDPSNTFKKITEVNSALKNRLQRLFQSINKLEGKILCD